VTTEIPKKDFLIFDGDCNFCQNSIQRFKNILGDSIEYVASKDLEEGFYGIDKEATNSSIKFFEHAEKKDALNDYEKVLHYDNHDVHEDAVIYHGAYAIFKSLSYNSIFKPLLFAYQWIPLFDVLSEAGYRIVARNRHQLAFN
jgi:predicted DCC family thiol-disulfide oxidoreductase YuxK